MVGRQLLEALRGSTSEEIRELGQLLLLIADEPRAAKRKSMFDTAIARLPEEKPCDLALAIAAARARVHGENVARV